MTPTTSILVLLATALPTPSIQEINYQPDSEEDEFCHEESMQLGLCLGKQQQTIIDITDEIIYDCIQCSGAYRGDETCEELKQLHNSSATTTESINVLTGEVQAISGGDELSFCETYNNCVKTNCPPTCWKEHVRWLECVIIELDCDLGCESVELGHGFVGEEFMWNDHSQGVQLNGTTSIMLGLVGFCFAWVVSSIEYDSYFL